MDIGYFSAAWQDIKNSPGWMGKVCLLGIISWIPVFGSIVLNGYAWGWARDIAWDVHRPMPKRIFGNEDGKLYSRGFFAFLVGLIIGAIIGVLSFLLSWLPLSSIILLAVQVLLYMYSFVMIMRASIYANYSAGFQFGRVWAMCKHDSAGLARILGMVVLIGVATFVIVFLLVLVVVVLVAIAGVVSIGASTVMYVGNMQMLATILPYLGVGIAGLLGVCYVASCILTWAMLMYSRAMGYWTRQFDVAQWRGQDDPMPFECGPSYAWAGSAYASQQGAGQAGSAYESQQGAGWADGRSYGGSQYETPASAPEQKPAPAADPSGAAAPAAGYRAEPEPSFQSPPAGAQVPASAPAPEQAPSFQWPPAPEPGTAAAVSQASGSDGAQQQDYGTASCSNGPSGDDGSDIEPPAYAGRPVASEGNSRRRMHAEPAPRWDKIDLDGRD